MNSSIAISDAGTVASHINAVSQVQVSVNHHAHTAGFTPAIALRSPHHRRAPRNHPHADELRIGEARLPEPDSAVVDIRLGDASLATDAAELVERRFAWRGYSITRVPAPDVCTFVAERAAKILGTIGIRVDGDAGLSSDALYASELDAMRTSGARLCEFTRLAVDPEAGRPVLAKLYHAATLYGSLILGCSHVMIEVNPRHEAFYRRMFGFERYGEERMDARVAAPAVLLGVSFETMARGLANGRTASGREHPIYAHYWGPDEAMRVVHRIESALARQGG